MSIAPLLALHEALQDAEQFVAVFEEDPHQELEVGQLLKKLRRQLAITQLTIGMTRAQDSSEPAQLQQQLSQLPKDLLRTQQRAADCHCLDTHGLTDNEIAARYQAFGYRITEGLAAFLQRMNSLYGPFRDEAPNSAPPHHGLRGAS